MTLIIGMRCSDGAVLCADSQETIGNYRMWVQKIKPERMGNYVVIVGGSGIGDLVDGFIECLRRRITALQTRSLTDFQQTFENELARYCRREVPLYNAAQQQDKKLDFIVSAYVNGAYDLWRNRGTRLTAIDTYYPIGWVEPLYNRILQSLYKPGMSVAQGVLACVYTLGIAESTSNYIRGPMQVGGVNSWGAWLDGPGYVSATNDRLLEFERKTQAILLASADIGMNISQYKQLLDTFTADAMRLHKEFTVASLRRFLSEPAETWRSINTAYNRIPPALSVAVSAGDLDDILGPGEKADLLQKMINAAKIAYPVEGQDSLDAKPSSSQTSEDQP